MRLRPSDPAKELKKAERELADAEHKLRYSFYGKRPSVKMKQREKIDLLQAKVNLLRHIVGE